MAFIGMRNDPQFRHVFEKWSVRKRPDISALIVTGPPSQQSPNIHAKQERVLCQQGGFVLIHAHDHPADAGQREKNEPHCDKPCRSSPGHANRCKNGRDRRCPAKDFHQVHGSAVFWFWGRDRATVREINDAGRVRFPVGDAARPGPVSNSFGTVAAGQGWLNIKARSTPQGEHHAR